MRTYFIKNENIGKTCTAEDCTDAIKHTVYCNRHYKQMQRYGKTFDTIFQKRPAIIEGDIAKIPLGVNAKDGYAIVDKEFAWVDKYNWSSTRGYVVSHNRKERRRLHRIVTACDDGMVVDHINHNPLDNRLSNLRVCTHAENMKNMVKPRDNKSGYKGVFWDNRKNRWHVKLQHDNTPIFIGYFTDKILAAQAYDERASELFGQYAKLNFERNN